MKRKNSDEYVRGLERKVLGGDLSVVPELARAYDRLGRGEKLTEVQVAFEDGTIAPVVVRVDHPFAQARYWSAEVDPSSLEYEVVDVLRRLGVYAALESTRQGQVKASGDLGDGYYLEFGYGVNGSLSAALLLDDSFVQGWPAGEVRLTDPSSIESWVASTLEAARQVTARSPTPVTPRRRGDPPITEELAYVFRSEITANSPATVTLGSALDSVTIGTYERMDMDMDLVQDELERLVRRHGEDAEVAPILQAWRDARP